MKKLYISILLAGSLLANSVFAQTAVVPSVNALQNKPATYRAVVSNLSPTTSPTDIFRISGSASKTIYIKSISVTGHKTTSGSLILNLFKRSTANSDGTTISLTAHPLDSGFAAATATPVAITANMTVGTGVIVGSKLTTWVTSANASSPILPAAWEFGGFNPESYLVLRGAAQGLTVNLGGTTQTGGVAAIEVEWMEM